MRKWLLKSIVSMAAMAAALQFSACSDNKKVTDDEEEEDPALSVSYSSSSSDKGSSSSVNIPDLSDDLTDVDQGKMTESKDLTAPSGISMTRLAPSVFQLAWDYSSSSTTISGFIVQRMGPTATEWEDLGALAPTVTHLVIDGSKNMDYYYRLAAFYGDTRSAYSSEVLVSRGTSYQSELGFPVVPQVVANIDRDSLLELVLTGNYPTQATQYSVYNYDTAGNRSGEVYYEARFVYGSSYSVDTVKFSLDQGVVSKKFKSIDDECNSFGQVRVVWKDKNGVNGYGDWTTPIGTKTGTTSGLNGDISALCADVVVEESGFATPKDLKADDAAGVWMLEWSYDEIADHPATNGFAIQRLDLTKSTWVDVGATGAGVLRYRVGMPTESYNYYRVAAVDKDKKRSAYSGDVLITVANAENTLNTPVVVGATEYSKTKMTLSWTYEENEKRPVNGFRIEELNLTTNAWTTSGNVGADVRKFLIGVSSSNRFFRVVAKDSSGEVASADFEIPANATSAYALAAPVIGSITDISDAEQALTWTYTDNDKRPASGFVIQTLDLAKGAWGSTKAVAKSVMIYKVAVAEDARYMRVGAYEGGDTVYATSEWFIPGRAAQAATEALLATPSMKDAVTADGWVYLSWSYTNSTSRPAKNIDLQIFKGNAWNRVATVGLNASRYAVETADTVRYYRVVAYDAKDSSYSNDVKVDAKSVVQEGTVSLSAPTITGVVALTAETQALTWTYAAAASRPATGFSVQYLAKNASGEYEWTEKAHVAKDIRRYIIEVSEENQFWRVAALDATDSAYSDDYLVAAVIYELSTPTNVKATVQKDNSVILSWTYKDNAKKPASGIRVEQVDLDAKAWTTLVGDVPTNVTLQQIPAATSSRYLRVVAFVEEAGVVTAEAMSDMILVEATSSAAEILPAPTGVSASVLASGKVKLTWSYAANAARPIKNFVPQWSADALTWKDESAVDSTVHTANVTGPTEAQGGLYYRVAAVDTSAAAERSFSVATYVEYQDVAVNLPAPVMATPEKLSNGYYALSWSYTAAKKRPAVNFKLYKLNASTSKWEAVSGGLFDIDVTRTNVKPETEDAFYRLSAIDESNEESFSNDVKVAAMDDTDAILPAPTGVAGVMLASGKVRVSWTYTVNAARPATKFVVQMSENGSTWSGSSDVTVTDIDSRNAIVAGPSSGDGLFYRVAAFDKDNISSISTSVFVEYKEVSADLATPVMSTPTALSEGYYTLSWAYANNADHPAVNFQLYKFGTSDWEALGTKLDVTTLSKVVQAEDKDTYYRISAIDDANVETFSNQVKVEAYNSEIVTLPSPVGVTVTVLSSGEALVAWSYTADSKNPAVKFTVQSSETAETDKWTAAKTVDATVTQAKVSAPTEVQKGLFYRVVAYNKDDADSSFSPVVYKEYEDVVGDLNVPTLATPTQLADGSYSLSWSYTQSKTRPAAGFKVYVLNGATWTESPDVTVTLDANARRVTIPAPLSGEVYYRVSAYDADGEVYSNDVSVSAIEKVENLLPAPTGITATLLSSGKVQVSWTYAANSKRPAVSFRVENSATATGSWNKSAEVDSTTHLAIVTGPAKGDALYYRVVAIDDDDEESYSASQYVEYEVIAEDLQAPTMATPEKLANDQYTLSWTDNSTATRPAKNFQVYKLVDGNWKAEGSLLSTMTTHYTVDAADTVDYYRVAAVGEKGSTDLAYSAEVKVAAKDPVDMALSAPKGVDAVLLSTKQVKITWTYDDNANNKVQSFSIEISADGSDWTAITPVAVSSANARAVLVSTIPTVGQSGLFYRVVAVGATDKEYSDATFVEYQDVDVDLPAPTGLALTEVSSNDKTTLQYSLSWSYTALKAYSVKSFKIERLGASGWEDEVTGLAATVLRYVLTAETKDVYYRVVAIVTKDGADVETPSADIKVAAYNYVEPTYELPAPTNVTATLLTDGVLLNWNYTAEANRPAAGFVIKYYWNLGGSWSWNKAETIDDTSIRTIAVTEAPTKDNGKMYFRVAAYEGTDTSYSSAVLVEYVDLKGDLSVPTNLAYSAYNDKITLSWSYTDNENRPADHLVLQELKSAAGDWDDVTGFTNIDINTTRIEIDTDENDRYFRIAVVDASNSIYSADLLVPGVKTEELVLEAPDALLYSIKTDGTYELSWVYSQGTKTADYLEIQVNTTGSSASGSWAKITDLDASVSSYVLDDGHATGYYRVVAIASATEDTAASSTVFISAYNIDLTLPAPTNFGVVRLAPSVWELTWEYASESKRPETGFRVQKSDYATGSWTEEAQPKAAVLFNVLNGKDYLEKYFRVAAYDGEGCSYAADVWSEECQFSEYAEAVHITEEVAYRTDLAFSIPEPTVTVDTTGYVEIKQDPLSGDNYVHLNGAKAFVAITTEQAIKNIAQSSYTSSVAYEIRWVIDGKNYETEVDYKGTADASLIIDGTDDLLATTRTPDVTVGHEQACHAAYVQVRVKWTDTNGESDYSKWSDLTSISVLLGCKD